MDLSSARRDADVPVARWQGRGRWWAVGTATVLLVLLVQPLQRLVDLPAGVSTAVADLVQCVVAVVATGAAAARARASRRSRSSSFAAWALMTVAFVAWTTGQLSWAYHRVLLGELAPTTTLADVGFLGYAALAPPALLLLRRGTTPAVTGLRGLLDGLVVAGAMALTGWVLVLRHLVEQAPSLRLLLLSAAYPVSDVVVLTIALVLLARTRTTPAVAALAAGAALMAVGDSAYVYGSTTGSYVPGGLVDAVWTAALVAMVAACLVRPVEDVAARPLRPGLLVQLLPYLPLAVTVTVVAVAGARGQVGPATVLGVGALGVLVVVRQGLVIVDNSRLTLQLQTQTAVLARLAYSDPLTGLANRTAFTGALERAATARTPLVAAFCDLDAFKAVNDVCGHAVGDALLVAVAARLREVVRAGDVVARLGGDEFAVLAVPGGTEDEAVCAAALRSRLVTALSLPFDLPAGSVPVVPDAEADRRDLVLQAVSASVGVVSSAEVPGYDADALLQEADRRMYDQKRSRRAVTHAH